MKTVPISADHRKRLKDAISSLGEIYVSDTMSIAPSVLYRAASGFPVTKATRDGIVQGLEDLEAEDDDVEDEDEDDDEDEDEGADDDEKEDDD